MLRSSIQTRIEELGVKTRYESGEPGPGWGMEQDPEAFSRLICLLAAYEPFDWSLDIGIGSGGATRLLREYVRIENTIVMDTGGHPLFPCWEEHKTHVPNTVEFRGDSHSEEARTFLSGLGRRFSLVGLDADHSETGVLQDWNLIQPFLRGGAIVWFHDIHSFGGVRLLWNQLTTKHVPLLETHDNLGLGVLRYGEP